MFLEQSQTTQEHNKRLLIIIEPDNNFMSCLLTQKYFSDSRYYLVNKNLRSNSFPVRSVCFVFMTCTKEYKNVLDI